MDVSVYCACVIAVDEALQEFTKGDKAERDYLLKMLKVATMIEAEDDDELPAITLRGFKALSHDQAEFIHKLRNKQLLALQSLVNERFVYKTLHKIYHQS